jgi:arylsulfatase A-like enzyme
VPPISRRTLLRASTATLATLATRARANERPQRSRPNILWLVSEDNFPFISAYGDRLAHTPTIDALATSGVLYQNAFSTHPVCAPSRYGIITGMYAQSAAPAQHMRAEARLPHFVQGFPKYLRDAGYYCTNNAKTDYNASLDVQALWHESSDRAHWRNRPANAPFFAVFNFMTTHESRLFAPTPGRVRPEDVRVPQYLPDTPDVRRDISSYYNLIERMDGEVAAHLAALDAAGLADDTIVFYYSDNGGVLPRSKRYCYDEGMRTALVMRVPEKWAHLAPASPGSIITTPVGLIDLAPTVLSMAGLSPPSYMHGVPLVAPRRVKRRQYMLGGRDRMDERYDFMRTARDERYRYIRNYLPHRIYGQHGAFEWQMDSYRAWERAYRAGQLNPAQRRFFGEKPAEELYDIEADPDQLENLVEVASHRKRLETMRAALDAHMLAVNDNGFIPESSPLEGYEASRAPGAYPLKRAMQLAARAIQRDARNAMDFATLLNDSNEVIRYWAVQGLLMLKQGAAPARDLVESCFRTDASTPVRIVAAELLALLGPTEPPVRYLGELVESHANARIRLQALNSLTALGESARLALAQVQHATRDSDTYVSNAATYLSLVLEGTYTPESQIYTGLGARKS